MTYEEARATVTMLMVADGLPAPDFTSDEPFRNDEGYARGDLSVEESVVFWLSPPKAYGGDYEGRITSTAFKALEEYLRSKNPK